MAKKEKRAVKAADKAPRWTVRGVSGRLQKAAGDVARARGLTLGQWLSEVVETAVANAPEAPGMAASGWRDTIESRLQRLETALLASTAATTAKPKGKPARDATPVPA